MNQDTIIFGTDGWRGLLGSELNDENIMLVAQAFADYLNRFSSPTVTRRAAIAFDGRQNSEHFAQLFAKVLSGNDILTHLSNRIIPTPTLSYYVKHMGFDAGVMITASHNPPQYNGVKFKAAYGGPFVTEETLKVEAFLEANPVKQNDVLICSVDMLTVYYQQLESYIDFASIRSAEIRIAIDSMGGAGQTFLQTLLAKHQCNAQTIFEITDEQFFGRAPEPIEQNLCSLMTFLSGNCGYSFGVATDGDADRVGVVLENGKWLSAQYTILLLNDYFVNAKNIQGGLVKTSSVTDKIKLFESSERKVFDVQVGFKYICELMVDSDIAIGCEESGGYGFKDHIPERDGLLSALLIAEMLAKSGCTKLSEYVERKITEFGEIFYDRIDYKCYRPDRIELLPKLEKAPPDELAGLCIKQILHYHSSRGIINGLKFILEGNCRWLLIRSSETEPLLRFYAEGNSNQEVQSLLQAGIQMINTDSINTAI